MNSKLVFLLLASGAGLLGCLQEKRQIDSTLDKTTAPRVQAHIEAVRVPGKALDCYTDFKPFLQEFSKGKDTQGRLIEYPLSKQVLVDGDPEPVPETRLMEQGKVELPVMPGGAERQSKGLELRTTMLGAARAEVLMYKPDTDYQLRYVFKKSDCWRLNELQDWSL